MKANIMLPPNDEGIASHPRPKGPDLLQRVPIAIQRVFHSGVGMRIRALVTPPRLVHRAARRIRLISGEKSYGPWPEEKRIRVGLRVAKPVARGKSQSHRQ